MFKKVGEKFGFFVKVLFWFYLIFTTIVFCAGIHFLNSYKSYMEYAGISFGSALVLWVLIYISGILTDYVFTLRRLCTADITEKTDKIYRILKKNTENSVPDMIVSDPSTKYCRYCGSVIPVDAVVCPECQKELY